MASQPSRGSSPRREKTSTFGSRTDVGCIREHNEDSLVVSPPLFAVADGMGGHAAGEVASEIAVTTLVEYAPARPDAEALGDAVIKANRAVINAAREGKGREGMGTTLTATMLEGERLVIAQVGDSRAYLLHGGKLQQLTRDHSLMADMIESGQLTPEEARVHPNRSVITRALGSDPNTTADLYEINVQAGDRLLVCSDGLSTMIEDDTIEDLLNKYNDPQRCANILVKEAIAAGGHDNVTVIVADVSGNAEIKQKRSARKVKAWMVFTILAILLVLGGTAYAFRTYTQTVAFLGNVDGKVAIYKGVPGNLLGMEFFELDEVTDVSVSDLQPGVASRLDEGIRVDSLEDAEDLVETYREEAAGKSEVPESQGSDTASDDGKSENATPGSSVDR